MMTVTQDFVARSAEIEGYFCFVLKMARQDLIIRNADGSTAFHSHEEDDLLKTLKASCYLLLYNLVESTMRNAIEAIFDELQRSQVHFDHCREEIRREILKNLKRRDMERLLPKLMVFARDVVHSTFERSEQFAGNLDARAIRGTAKRFGFAEPRPNEFWMLQTVKDLRNDLAHGVKSFADVGRNASPSDLELARTQTVDILSETLQNIEQYLQAKQYLHIAVTAATATAPS